MSRRSESVVPVAGEDIATSLNALNEDFDLEAHLLTRLAPGSTTSLLITAEARVKIGSRLVVARAIQVWKPGEGHSYMTRCMMALHQLYFKSSRLFDESGKEL
jgi:hypothetical protein